MRSRALPRRSPSLRRRSPCSRRRLADSPRQVQAARGEAARDRGQPRLAVTGQNERLAATLREARDQIVALKEEVDRLAQPPSGFGVFLSACEDDTADVFTGGREDAGERVPTIELDELRPGPGSRAERGAQRGHRPGV